jgi:hypothetical protein
VSEKKAEKLKLSELQKGQVVWSVFFQKYLIFEEFIEEDGYLFINAFTDGVCILEKSEIYDAPILIKELV